MTPIFPTAAREQETPPSSWLPEADWFIYVMLHHDGTVRDGARRLLFRALRDGLQRGAAPNRPSAPAYRHYSGSLGRYESAKAGIVEAGLSPAQYEVACRRAARRARV